MQTPESILKSEGKYKPDAWHEYTVAELAMWAHLLRKRAGMRVEKEKSQKDIGDALAYEEMMRAKLSA